MNNRLILNNGNFLLNEKKPITEYLSARDVVAIAGLSKDRTPVNVFNEKANGIRQDFDLLQKIAAAVKEPLIEWYCERNGAEGYHDVLIENGIMPFLSAKVDFLSKDQDFAVITKLTTMDNRSLYSSVEYDDYMPISLRYKAAYICLLTGVKHVDVVVMFSATSRITLRYTKDIDFENEIINKACNFWFYYVVANVMPTLKTMGDIKIAYPKQNTAEIEVSNEIIEAIATLKDIQEQRKGLEATARDMKKHEEKYELKIRKFAGDNGILKDGEKPLAKLQTTFRNGYMVKPCSFTTLRIL
jgi:predicted phage-related endonuclease